MLARIESLFKHLLSNTQKRLHPIDYSNMLRILGLKAPWSGY